MDPFDYASGDDQEQGVRGVAVALRRKRANAQGSPGGGRSEVCGVRRGGKSLQREQGVKKNMVISLTDSMCDHVVSVAHSRLYCVQLVANLLCAGHTAISHQTRGGGRAGQRDDRLPEKKQGSDASESSEGTNQPSK